MRGTLSIPLCRQHFIFVIFLYIFLRERKRASKGQREGERERIPSRFRTTRAEPDTGLDPVNREVMT